MRVLAAPRSTSLTPFLVIAVLTGMLLLGVTRASGATACPQAVATSTQCPKPVKAAAKSPTAKSPAAKASAAVAVAVVAVDPDPIATSWKSTLDPLSPGGWVMVTDGPVDNPSVVYASTHNVLHNGNVVTAWIRWEYLRIQAEIYPLHYQSAVTHEELDCDSRTYRRAAVFYYRRNNLQDKALQFTALNDDTTWKLAIPGTEGDAMLNWACAPPAVAHRTVFESKVDKKTADAADDNPDDKPAAKAGAKTAARKKAGAAAASSAPSSAPAATAGGIDLHTNR
jgi:hypothetical protein